MAQRYLFTNFWLILYCLLLMALFAVPFCGFASVNLHEGTERTNCNHVRQKEILPENENGNPCFLPDTEFSNARY